ncbi:unnamed protein product [Heterobilharzia americana]|nr:unnamed protein product [Heterobilharzia americana]
MKALGEPTSRCVSSLSMKAKANIRTWSVETRFEPSKVAQIAKEMRRYSIEVLGTCEIRWNESGLSQLSTTEPIIYYDIVNQTTTTSTLSFGVSIMMSPKASKALSRAVGINLILQQPSHRITSEHNSSNKSRCRERHKAAKSQESSRTRCNSSISTENRCRDNRGGHAHTHTAEGLR